MRVRVCVRMDLDLEWEWLWVDVRVGRQCVRELYIYIYIYKQLFDWLNIENTDGVLPPPPLLRTPTDCQQGERYAESGTDQTMTYPTCLPCPLYT